eukprot:gene4296-14406_t
MSSEGETLALQDKVVLVIGNVGAGNRRKLKSMKSLGVRLVCYNDVIPPWASTVDYIADEDWILGPAIVCESSEEECAEVAEVIRTWVKKSQSQEASGVSFPVVSKPCCYPKSFSVKWQSLEHIQAVAALPHLWDSLLDRWKDHGDMLLEEVIEGCEVDIDCIVAAGQLVFACVSDNYESLTSTSTAASQPPGQQSSPGSGSGTESETTSTAGSAGLISFVERGGCLPSKLSAAAQTQLLHLDADVAA